MGDALGAAILRVTGAIMLVGGLAVAIVPTEVPTPYVRWVVIVTLVAALALAWIVHTPSWLRPIVESRLLAPVLAVSGAVLSTWMALSIRYQYGWDAAVVMQIATRVSQGSDLAPREYDYLSLYPNNFPLVAIDRLGVSAGSALGLPPDVVLIIANGLCLALTLWLVHIVVRRVAGASPAALAMLLVLVLVGFSPLMAVPYTDIYAMVFLTAVPVLAFQASLPGRGHRWVAWVGAVSCAAMAYVIKTTPVVVVAGLLVIAVGVLGSKESEPGAEEMAAPRARPSRGRGWRVVTGIVLAGLTLGGFLAVSAGATRAGQTASGVDQTRIDAATSPPMIWWVANGMNLNTVGGLTRFGGYNRGMVDAIKDKSQAEMADYAVGYIDERWQQRGPQGMVRFYAAKAVWNWSDAMFWAWSEGGDWTKQPVISTPVGRALMQVNGFTGAHYAVRSSVTQGIWIAVLLVAGVGLLRARPRADLVLLALTTLGIGAFLLVFQGRSRYLLTFVPMIVALACAVIPALPRYAAGRSRVATRSGD
ncbi:hypothetical protein [Intrasporangium sp.]|uniref:hypothetical protein n=1 Tax=Intrasporangium sp. TaxID=1925024 RepID=UPI0033659A5A